MVQNLGQTDGDYVEVGPASLKVASQGFTTGSDSFRYRLQGIGVDIEGSDDSNGDAQVPDDASSVSVAVHADSSGEPGNKLFDLVSPDEFAAGLSFFKAPPNTRLEPDTSYVLVWRHQSGTNHRLQLTTASGGQDSGALPGFSIAGTVYLGADTSVLYDESASLKIVVYGVAERRPIVPRSGYQVARNWFHIPEGAQVGDQFRLLFVTRGGTYATSGDIEDYNAVAQWEPDQTYNDRFIRSVAPEFKAVVCTAAVDARTNTGMTDAVGVPVHWLDGGWDDRPTLVANSYAEFYGGEWVNHEWGAYVTGNSAHFNDSDLFTRYNKEIWTGCDARGVAHPYAYMGSTLSEAAGMVAVGTPENPMPNYAPLGAVDVDEGFVMAETDELGQIYVISPVFTVVP